MITQAHYIQLQQKFFAKAGNSSNPTKVTLKFIDTTTLPTGDDADIQEFMGNMPGAVTKEIVLGCLYKQRISDKQRAKAGVEQEVDTLLYISPIELEAKNGSREFADYIANGMVGISVEFLGVHGEVRQINPLEPMTVDMKQQCIAYEIGVKTTLGINSPKS